MADSLSQIYKNQSHSRRQTGVNGKRIALRWIIAVLAILLLGQIIYFGVIAPRMAIKTVRINGLYGLSEEEILGAAGIHAGMLILDVQPELMRQSLLRIPQIKDASLKVEGSNTLVIDLSQREALGRVMLDGEIYFLDAAGVLFPPSNGRSLYQGPILSGLPFEEQRGLDQVPHPYQAFLADLEQMKLEEPALFGVFSQFDFQSLEPAGFQTWVYPTHVQQRVLVGERFTSDHAVAMLRVLAMLEERGELGRVWNIDFRSGDVIYRRSGGGQ